MSKNKVKSLTLGTTINGIPVAFIQIEDNALALFTMIIPLVNIIVCSALVDLEMRYSISFTGNDKDIFEIKKEYYDLLV